MEAYRCSACGGLNRVKHAPTGKRPICGRCKTPLQAQPQAVSGAELDELLAKAPVPVLVDFWAAWCGPCRMAGPILERLAERFAGKIIVVKLDTEADQRTAAAHGVQSLPTFALFSGGREVARQAGLPPEASFAQWLQQQLATAA